MDEEITAQVKPKRTRKKRRKSLPRPTRYRGRLKKPGVASAMKAKWQDPEWRAAMMVKRRAHGDAMKLRAGSRAGIPDGMRRAEADVLIEASRIAAKETMSDLEKAGLLTDADDAAKLALQGALEVLRDPGNKATKLAAARLVLDFTKAKPASKSEITVNKAEEWLAAVAAENDDDKGEVASDA